MFGLAVECVEIGNRGQRRLPVGEHVIDNGRLSITLEQEHTANGGLADVLGIARGCDLGTHWHGDYIVEQVLLCREVEAVHRIMRLFWRTF